MSVARTACNEGGLRQGSRGREERECNICESRSVGDIWKVSESKTGEERNRL